MLEAVVLLGLVLLVVWVAVPALKVLRWLLAIILALMVLTILLPWFSAVMLASFG